MPRINLCKTNISHNYFDHIYLSTTQLWVCGRLLLLWRDHHLPNIKYVLQIGYGISILVGFNITQLYTFYHFFRQINTYFPSSTKNTHLSYQNNNASSNYFERHCDEKQQTLVRGVQILVHKPSYRLFIIRAAHYFFNYPKMEWQIFVVLFSTQTVLAQHRKTNVLKFSDTCFQMFFCFLG